MSHSSTIHWTSSPGRVSLRRGLIAAALAAAVNAVILWGLARINARPVLAPAVLSPVRTVAVPPRKTEPVKPDTPQPQSQPRLQQRVSTVHLDDPQPPRVQPLNLQLRLPEPAFSLVRVATPVAVQQSAVSAPAPEPTAASNDPMPGDAVDQPPREQENNPTPAFPAHERRQGVTGEVVVKLLIDETGRVRDAQVLRGRGAFADAVLDVAGRWRFTPARHGGRAVRVWAIKTIRFEIGD